MILSNEESAVVADDVKVFLANAERYKNDPEYAAEVNAAVEDEDVPIPPDDEDEDEDESESITYLSGEGYDDDESEVVAVDVVTDQIYADFIGKPNAKPSSYKFVSKELAKRNDELENLIVRRMVAVRTASPPWDYDATIKAAKHTIIQLSAERDKKGIVTKWTVDEETAEKLAVQCMSRALTLYEYKEITGAVSRINGEMGLKDVGTVVGDGNKKFTKALFNAIAAKEPVFLYPPRKVSKEGIEEVLSQEQIKARTRKTKDSINFTAATAIAKEISKLKKSIGDREYTPDENAEMDLLKTEQLRIWKKFWTETGAAITNAEITFGKAAKPSKKRVTMKNVFRNVITKDSINLGIHEIL